MSAASSTCGIENWCSSRYSALPTYAPYPRVRANTRARRRGRWTYVFGAFGLVERLGVDEALALVVHHARQQVAVVKGARQVGHRRAYAANKNPSSLQYSDTHTHTRARSLLTGELLQLGAHSVGVASLVELHFRVNRACNTTRHAPLAPW